jgi:aryl-alcohol dehydrogenase-like predicted oxidoreductase
MALAPWNVLAGGKFRTDAEEEARGKTGEYRKMFPDFERTEREKKVSRALEKVAGEVGTKHITAGVFISHNSCLFNTHLQFSVAIAYLLHKVPYVFPLIGGRKVEHLLANLEALDISLSVEQMKELEAATDFSLGFPGWMIVSSRRMFQGIDVC